LKPPTNNVGGFLLPPFYSENS
ncbi:MAG: hypothetical protein K0R55_4293, partial [Sporomusa sp.]|nr:hypothetical protein [Sporomusa sp.]